MTKLTTNSQETTIGELFSIGPSLYLIPFFQREYRWSPDKVKNLIQDILNVVDGVTDKHFLGAIIIHGRKSAPTEPRVYEVIDGQQRLTTTFLFISALVKFLAQVGEYKEASLLAQNFLQMGHPYRGSNLRIHSCRLDRTMMHYVIDDICSDGKFVSEMSPYQLSPLPVHGDIKGAVRNNYNRFKRFFSEEHGQGGLPRVRAIYEAFFGNFTVVQIDVLDPTDGPKIFDSLNSQQEPMKISDLVRNEIFRKVADQSSEFVEDIDSKHWQPFYESFNYEHNNLLEKFLFPYALTIDQNVRKSEVFIKLRDIWSKSASPVDIIADLAQMRGPFMQSATGENYCKFSKLLAGRFQQLVQLGAPGSMLPFTMQVAKATADGQVSEETAVSILDVVQTFLVRRALCGFEPTGLHAVFKRLWLDIREDLSITGVSKALSSHKTVSWPSEADVKEAIKTRPMFKAAITPYFLLEFDRSLGGDAHERIETTEHVLPQRPCNEWKKHYGEERLLQDTDALPNLLPLTGKMNSSLGNQLYVEKRKRFEADSKFKSVREFAKFFVDWNAQAFDQRAEEMAIWAVKRWPHNKPL